MMSPQDFVKNFGNKMLPDPEPVRFAKIDPAYISGQPRLIFPGESETTLKKYRRLESYPSPVAGDNVMVFHGVIIGKII